MPRGIARWMKKGSRAAVMLGVGVLFLSTLGGVSPASETIDDQAAEETETQEVNVSRNKSVSARARNIESLEYTDYDSANMVNYHVDTGEITYEYFDMDSYSKRSALSAADIQSIDSDEILRAEAYVPENATYEAVPNTIFGDDDRIQVTDTQFWPYRATAYIKTKYTNPETGHVAAISYGTGFIMGPNLLVTAAHCIYTNLTGYGSVFPTTVEVYAGIDGETAADSSYVYYAEATTISVQKEYYETFDTDYDWAAIELDWSLGDEVGYYGIISNWYESGAEVYSYGYPGDKDDHTMWEAPGNLLRKTDYRYRFDFDVYKGQSGSPIFMTHENGNTYVCGIVTYEAANDNGGTRFNSFIYHYIFSYRGYYNYTHYVGTISPDEYGFADAYPTSPSYETNYVEHSTDLGFTFQTVRYRTGYIHDEYIVMSCIRRNINTAYIEYKFDVPVSMIIVDLSHWRTRPYEWLDNTNGMAELQYWSDNRWNTQMDLLSENTNLPTDRTNPTTYFIFFHEPTYRFRFYSESYTTNTNDDNRGRICIGDITFFATGGSI